MVHSIVIVYKMGIDLSFFRFTYFEEMALQLFVLQQSFDFNIEFNIEFELFNKCTEFPTFHGSVDGIPYRSIMFCHFLNIFFW